MSSNVRDSIIETLKQRVRESQLEPKLKKTGQVIEVFDGIARISGLTDCKYAEMLSFSNNIFGVALNLEEDEIGAIILGDYTSIKEGDEAETTGRILEVPVSEALLGRVVDPLGYPKDGKPLEKSKTFYPIEKIAPSVITRQSVHEPLQTGIKAIDAMIPIGRGQRELIIGDRQTGKTALAIDTIMNQKDQDVICIYVAIGQKDAKIARIVAELRDRSAMEYTFVIDSSASDPAALSYLAPYAGCAMGEYFMDQGKDVLIVYDDLSKHAIAYRQISLLLQRPPGREAYPGDIFYLHSRLLERSAKLSDDFGGGSMTALPIIETQAGDVSAYIPTNVISITDGQIYLEPDLFYKGIRPAVNVGLSVSRVGSAAQIKAMKQVAGQLKLSLAQFRELEAFAQFGSELDETTKKQIIRGQRLTEILKQDQFSPIPVAEQVCIFYAAIHGYLDDIPVARVKAWEETFCRFLGTQGKKLLKEIHTKKMLDAPLEKQLKEAISEQIKLFQ